MNPEVSAEIERELGADRALLERTAMSGLPGSRLWWLDSYAIVAGRSSNIASEVYTGLCARRGIPVIRRFSGGGVVMVGPGTLQWAIALPQRLLGPSYAIAAARDAATSMVSGILGLDRDGLSGDLLRGNRKVGGVAMRKVRGAVLVHGSLLVRANIGLITRTLRHPPREPGYRQGRLHTNFLDNIGALDRDGLARGIDAALAQMVELGQLDRRTRQTDGGGLTSNSLPSG